MEQTEKIPQGYKNSPLGVIPEEWEVKRIKNWGKVLTGNTPPTAEQDNYGSDFLFVSPADLSDNKYISKTEKRLSNKGFSISRIMPKGTILYTCIGSTIGKSGIANMDLTSNQQINAIICNKLNNNEFLYYELSYKSNKIKLLAGEQAVPIINKSDFENIKIACPPLPEQQKIAEILTVWDEAIEKQTRLIEKLETRKRGLMQQLLTGKKLLKGFEKKKWKMQPLSDCLEYAPREVAKPDSNFLALGIRSHGKGIFHKTDFDPEDIAMDVLYQVKENDLILNITFAWEHAVAIASKKDEGGLVSHRFPTYTFRSENAIADFFRFYILQKRFKFLLELISPGGAGRNRVMNKTDFLKLEVKIPCVAEQNAIADILSASDKEIELAKNKLAALKEQKKGLMQQLLTGKKRVKI